MLTEQGLALSPALTALRQWGEEWVVEWVVGEGDEPLLLEHRGRGEMTHVVATCGVCGDPLDTRSVRAVAGPGAITDVVPHRHAPT